MAAKLRIGIIGLGRISAVHIKTYSENERTVIQAIAENNEQLLSDHVHLVQKGRAYLNYQQLLADPDIDAVAILLPHYLHAPVIKSALAAGKHVICEKPLVTDVGDVKGINSLSKKTGRRVYLKQYFRFSKLHHDAMRFILDGALGKPYLISCLYTVDATSEFNNPSTWRFNRHEAGGGVFLDVGVHMLDYLQEVFGNPLSVTALTKNLFSSLPYKGEDVSVVTLEYKGGVIANIICSAGDSSYGFRWEKHFFGTGGSLHIDDIGKRQMNLTVRKNNHIVVSLYEKDWWERANTAALNDIINRIIAGEPPAISLDDAEKTLQVIHGAYKSGKLHKAIFFR